MRHVEQAGLVFLFLIGCFLGAPAAASEESATLRVGLADEDTNPIAWFVSAGIGVKGTIPTRERDRAEGWSTQDRVLIPAS